jgi:hypothetical protein
MMGHACACCLNAALSSVGARYTRFARFGGQDVMLDFRCKSESGVASPPRRFRRS